MPNLSNYNNLINQEERIDRYLKKQLSEEEVTAFEQDLKRDADLRKHARFIAQTLKALKTAEEGGMMKIVPQSGFKAAAKNPFTTKNKKK